MGTTNDGMQSLIGIVNQLQDAFASLGGENPLDLPQVCCRGCWRVRTFLRACMVAAAAWTVAACTKATLHFTQAQPRRNPGSILAPLWLHSGYTLVQPRHNHGSTSANPIMPIYTPSIPT